MKNCIDKVWMWDGWPIVKYPCGILILWLVLSQIWYLETVEDYDKVVVERAVTTSKFILIPPITFHKTKLFSKDRMLVK